MTKNLTHSEEVQHTPEHTQRSFHWEHWQSIAVLLAIYDIFAVTGSYFLALFVRFDLHYSAIPAYYLQAWLRFAPVYAGLCLLVFALMRLYNSLWRFASFSELIRVTIATLITGGAHALLITYFFGRMPLSYYGLGAIFQGALTLGIRFSYSFLLQIGRAHV